jgi:hypothetical protein
LTGGIVDEAASASPGRIQVGIGHAGRTVTVEEAATTFRVYDGDQLLTEVLRTTAKQIAGSKPASPNFPDMPALRSREWPCASAHQVDTRMAWSTHARPPRRRPALR